jgi:hypothetical protein
MIAKVEGGTLLAEKTFAAACYVVRPKRAVARCKRLSPLLHLTVGSSPAAPLPLPSNKRCCSCDLVSRQSPHSATTISSCSGISVVPRIRPLDPSRGLCDVATSGSHFCTPCRASRLARRNVDVRISSRAGRVGRPRPGPDYELSCRLSPENSVGRTLLPERRASCERVYVPMAWRSRTVVLARHAQRCDV